MTRKIPSYLKLHVETPADEPAKAAADNSWAALCGAFETATGWSLRIDERSRPRASVAWSAAVELPDGSKAAQVSLETVAGDASLEQQAARSSVDLERAVPLAEAIARLWAESDRLRRAVREREADLAAGVPVVSRGSEEKHLAVRLESVLKGGAEAVGCDAAALYLLDDATSELKLRSLWGLPEERLLAAPRSLRTALADLEALVGHAVVLEDAREMPQWQSPEDFASAVCVPVSTPTVPLGTLWMFSSRPRPFSDEETNLIEIVAGRIATELEREVLLGETFRSKRLEGQLDALSRSVKGRLPRFAPPLEDWRVAACNGPLDGLGGEFYDWSILNDGTLAVAVGSAPLAPLEAALATASLQAALKSHASYPHNPAQLHARVNETLWTGSAGDQLASLFYGRIDCESGQLEFATAGRPLLLLCDGAQLKQWDSEAPPLGTQPDCEVPLHRQTIQPGQLLLVLSEGAREALKHGRVDRSDVHDLVRKSRGGGADQLVKRFRDLLERATLAQAGDWTVLAIERRGKRRSRKAKGRK